jgi:DNA-binding Lrp family transcriptional regulator
VSGTEYRANLAWLNGNVTDVLASRHADLAALIEQGKHVGDALRRRRWSAPDRRRSRASTDRGRAAIQLAGATRFCWIAASPRCGMEAAMVPFFIQIKCQLGKSYQVANALADREIASEIYSTAGEFDLLCKFYVDAETDIGHFVNEKVQTVPGIQDTRTIITFKAFGA